MIHPTQQRDFNRTWLVEINTCDISHLCKFSFWATKTYLINFQINFPIHLHESKCLYFSSHLRIIFTLSKNNTNILFCLRRIIWSYYSLIKWILFLNVIHSWTLLLNNIHVILLYPTPNKLDKIFEYGTEKFWFWILV